jgi:hypothetical protein
MISDYDLACKRIEEIFQAEQGCKEDDELEVLITLANAYEEIHFPIEARIRTILLQAEYGGNILTYLYKLVFPVMSCILEFLSFIDNELSIGIITYRNDD